MKKQIAVIGLEMHCELKSNSKVFSSAKNAYSEIPNSNIAPLDMAFPGTLPVVNKKCVLNALKVLGKIDHDIFLISPSIIEPIQKLKTENLGNNNPRLHVDEILIALAISATTNPLSHTALKQLPKLRDAQAHSSVILSDVDLNIFRKLGIHLTCEPVYQTKKLYHK